MEHPVVKNEDTMLIEYDAVEQEEYVEENHLENITSMSDSKQIRMFNEKDCYNQESDGEREVEYIINGEAHKSELEQADPLGVVLKSEPDESFETQGNLYSLSGHTESCSKQLRSKNQTNLKKNNSNLNSNQTWDVPFSKKTRNVEKNNELGKADQTQNKSSGMNSNKNVSGESLMDNPKRMTEEQKRFLLNYMKENPIFNHKRGYFLTPEWKELTAKINQIFGPKKNLTQWRHTWVDWQHKTKIRYWQSMRNVKQSPMQPIEMELVEFMKSRTPGAHAAVFANTRTSKYAPANYLSKKKNHKTNYSFGVQNSNQNTFQLQSHVSPVIKSIPPMGNSQSLKIPTGVAGEPIAILPKHKYAPLQFEISPLMLPEETQTLLKEKSETTKVNVDKNVPQIKNKAMDKQKLRIYKVFNRNKRRSLDLKEKHLEVERKQLILEEERLKYEQGRLKMEERMLEMEESKIQVVREFNQKFWECEERRVVALEKSQHSGGQHCSEDFLPDLGF